MQLRESKMNEKKKKNETKRMKKKEKKDIAYYIVENAGYCLKKYTREARELQSLSNHTERAAIF